MNLIYPYAEFWEQKDPISHVARCARVCYASETDSKESNEKLVKSLKNKKHHSMFRHESVYYIISKIDVGTAQYTKIYNKLREYLHCPYIQFKVFEGKIYVATNGNFVLNKDNEDLLDLISDYQVSFVEFENTEIGYMMLRLTIYCVTQISTSRELNRVSPNNIAEQSTRYVNFGKKGGITICLPHWWHYSSNFKKFIFKSYWKMCELMYNFALKFGMKPEDAREFLPLCTATKCVYTYSLDEWNHIMDLRLKGTTGKPHPNAANIVGKIYTEITSNGYSFD